MTKKQKIKIVLMTVIIICIVCSANFVLCRQLNSRSDGIRVKNFYRLEKDSLDMVLIGASTAYTDYSAPLAWKEFGYTSYSLGTNMAPMGIAKSMLIEVRKTQKPKLIVIDINGVLYNDEQESREGSKRLWIDNMPFSKNKLDTINELVDKEDRMAYYVPLLKYHSNWERLNECIEQSIDELTHTDKINLSARGMQGNARIDPQKHYVNIKEHNDMMPMHKLSGQHLKELLEYLQSEKINNVIFTNMPRFYSKKMLPERKRNNAAKALIREYGFECIDMDEHVEEIGLDPKKDFYNPNHLNIYGQKKLTKYFGKMINERYGLSEGKRDDKLKHRYDQEYKSYTKIYNWADKHAKAGKNKRYNYDDVKHILES